jgi:hypothetical protein
MDKINRWKLADELTVFQISLLIAGHDPSEFDDEEPANWPNEVKIDTAAFIAAIKNAVKNHRIDFKEEMRELYGNVDTDWSTSTINIESLRNWLSNRDYQDGFFISKDNDQEKLFDKKGAFYAPKLAAAVRAWNELTSDPEAFAGKSPKKALEIWLRKHANEYGLTGKDGNPNKLGIEEICKVANWKPNGGASPTPSPSNPPTVFGKPPREFESWGRKERPKPPTQKPDASLDDDIPF